jgi:hypothetical protein
MGLFQMRKHWALLLCLILLTLQLIFQIRLSVLDSQTTDEAVHLSAGYTYLTEQDFRFNPEHPPLVKMLAALPLLALDVRTNDKTDDLWHQAGSKFFYDSWQENRLFGEELLFRSGNNPDELLFWARLPIVGQTFILGLTICLIAWRHWGKTAALIATGLYATNPTVTGHGHLVTTDIGLALGFLLAIYAFWRFMQQPSWPKGIWFGLAFGFALLTKHTAIILLPAFFFIALWLWRDKSRHTRPLRTLGQFVGGLIVTVVVIWAGFLFKDPPAPAVSSLSDEIYQENLAITENLYPEASWASDSDFQLKIEELEAVRDRVKKYDEVYPRIRPFFSFLPGNYLKGVYLVLGHASGGHDSFLLGQTSNQGWWYYFPLLFLLKTPLGALIIVAGGLFVATRRSLGNQLSSALLIGAGVFLLSAMTSKSNLGLRHVLPFFPLLFLIAGFATTISRRFLSVAVLGLAWSVTVFVTAFPSYLPYFNEFAGSKEGWYHIAGDSNIDWGQDLKRIAKFVEIRQIKQPYIEYNWLGNYALDYYLGANAYRKLSEYQPGQGGYAIMNVSAVNNPNFTFSQYCQDQEFITPGVVGCHLQSWSIDEN